MNISLKQGYDMFIFDRETYCKEKTIQNYKNTLSYFFKIHGTGSGLFYFRDPPGFRFNNRCKKICRIFTVKKTSWKIIHLSRP